VILDYNCSNFYALSWDCWPMRLNNKVLAVALLLAGCGGGHGPRGCALHRDSADRRRAAAIIRIRQRADDPRD